MDIPSPTYLHANANGDPTQLIAHLQQRVIAPLRAFRQQVAPLNHTHTTCVQNCASALASLLSGRSSNGLPLMQGAGADALADTFGQFFDAAQQLSGSIPGELYGRLSDAAQISERRADLLEEDLHTLLQQARSSSSAQTSQVQLAAGTLSLQAVASGAEGVAVTLDAGAAMQGGLDIPWDVAAAGASIIALGLAAAVTLSSSSAVITPERVSEVEQEHFNAYTSDMDNGPDQEPLPPEPPSPKGPQSSFGIWIALIASLGITAGLGLSRDTFTSAQPLPPDIINKPCGQLSPQERAQVIQNLIQSYNCRAVNWERFLDVHSNLTVRQIKYYLDILSQIQAMQEEAISLANQYRPEMIGPGLLKRIQAQLERLLNYFFRSDLTITDIVNAAGGNKGLWYELSWVIAMLMQGRLTQGPHGISSSDISSSDTSSSDTSSSASEGPATDLDLTIDGGTTLVELKASGMTYPHDIRDMLKKIPKLFEFAQKNGIKEVDFYFQADSIPDSVRAAIEQKSRETGIPFKIDLNVAAPAPYPRSTTWCSDPSLQETPSPSSQSTPTPPSGGDDPGPSGSPPPTPTPTPSPSPTPRAVPTPFLLP
ncbi:hypothetical protein [Thermogemmatispora sp.]|uniref:hypothetical protein n=1 Tax=Thermogemmatispora sp. TaxID=1968838 RepID=UPI0035E4455E